MPNYIVLTPSGAATTANAALDHANGLVRLYWKNPNGSTASYNRVYHRRTANGGSLTLLFDNVPAVIGSQQSVIVMDQIALSTAYDYYASAVTSGGAESSLVQIGTNVKIDPTQGGNYTAMLHLAGNGLAYHAPLYLTGAPKVKEVIDAQAASMFSLQAPVFRYGGSDYREIGLKLRQFHTDADPYAASAFASLQAVLKQMRSGSVAYYRDQAGVMLTVALKDATQNFMPTGYLLLREPDLSLVQVPNQYTPSAATGSSLGLFQQVNGNVQPLDPMEYGI